jgi:hypothetical protein
MTRSPLRTTLAFTTLAFTAIALTAAALGCAAQRAEETPTQPSNLTPGVVKLRIAKGQTTQQQIVETFGPPDLVTHKDDQQIWTYDKTSYDYQKDSGYLTVIFAGVGGDHVRSNSKSTLLIVYFDKNDIVTDYRLSAVKF